MTLHYNRGSERSKRTLLRHNATDAERRLWQHLRGKQLGDKFRRQYSVDAYVVDFYAPRAKLAIEVDGESHFTPAAMAYDGERTAHLKQFGIELLRFTNREVLENTEGVVASIAGALRRRTSPGPSLVRRGGPYPSKRGGRTQLSNAGAFR